MLLPDKYVSVERSLLGQAATILRARTKDHQTVSELWVGLSRENPAWTFGRFALALSLLFAFGLVTLDDGVLNWRTL
jgi:hypothetical protein